MKMALLYFLIDKQWQTYYSVGYARIIKTDHPLQFMICIGRILEKVVWWLLTTTVIIQYSYISKYILYISDHPDNS